MIELTRESFQPGRLEEFWRFVNERQRIWEARFVTKSPPPWTIDRVLATQRFTNVYRELDPGTQYAIHQILERSLPAEDRIFNVMLYRLIGKSETHRELGFQSAKSFDGHHLISVFKKLRARGQKPFTAAYLVSGYHSMGTSDKAVNIARLFGRLQERFPQFYPRLLKAPYLARAYDVVRGEYGFGNFLAYQILVDLTYPLTVEAGHGLLPFSHDEWAAAGPGARRGIALLTGSVSGNELEVMRWLRDNQRLEFRRLGLPFPYLTDRFGREVELSLANIQNCLCEYHKYAKIKEGRGRGRRLFSPRDSERRIQLPLTAY